MSTAAPGPGSDQLSRAHRYAARSWRPFPCEPRGKRPIETSPGTRLKWGTACATPPGDKMLNLWFGGGILGAPVNIGIAAKPSRLVFLDADREDAMAELCAAYGQEVPQTYRVRTAKGWHYYFDAPQHVEISNAPGPLGMFGFDVRGGRGEGGYVIAAGSIHESGHVYAAEDDDADTIELPWWLVELLLPAPEPEGVTTINAEPRGDRRYTRTQARDWIERYAAAPLRLATEGGRNSALNTASIVVGHFVPSYLDEQAARKRLAEMAREVGLDAEEIGKTINSGLRAGMAEPYVVTEDAEETAGEDQPTAEEIAERRRARLLAERIEWLQADSEARRKMREAAGDEPFVADELHRLEVRETARQLHDLANMAKLRVLDAKEFLEAPMPEYLVRGFLYRASTAKVYGPPGGTKSFFLLDVALHLATGRTWRDRKLPRTRVHYVMAEGQAVNTLRALGWLAHHRVRPEDLDGWFTAIPQGVLLTPEGVDQYLAEVKAYQPGLIILDTKNRMMVGEENSASDVAVMIRAMDAIREMSGACVCLVDHTGLVDQTRGRGSNAVTAAMDSEIRVGMADGVATAEVTRDKAGVTGEKISYRLVAVEGVETPEGVARPAVCEPTEVVVVQRSEVAEAAWREWADPALWPLPSDVIKMAERGNGRAAIPDVARYLRHHASDQNTAGRSCTETARDIMAALPHRYSDGKVLRDAWDRLLATDDGGRILNLQTKNRRAATHWIEKPSDPPRPTQLDNPTKKDEDHAADHATP